MVLQLGRGHAGGLEGPAQKPVVAQLRAKEVLD